MASYLSPIPEAAQRRGRRETWAAAAAVLLFLAWLFLPLAYARFRRAPGRDPVRVREVVRKPALNGRPLADYLRDFALYFEKSSPIRPLLIPRFMAFKLYTLGLSSVSSVVVGRENWLFVGHETDTIDELRYFLGCHLMSEETMASWLRALKRAPALARAQGDRLLAGHRPQQEHHLSRVHAGDLSPRAADPP